MLEKGKGGEGGRRWEGGTDRRMDGWMDDRIIKQEGREWKGLNRQIDNEIRS